MNTPKYKTDNKLFSTLDKGFTLMEVLVSVTIFATSVTLMLTLFNYNLKLYRRIEAQRQVSQSVRTTMEFLVKEIRNGTVDYSVQDGLTVINPITPCTGPNISTSPVQSDLGGNSYSATSTYLALTNIDNERECIYWEHDGTLGDEDVANNNIRLRKANLATIGRLNPVNVKIKDLRFYIKPLRDPYTATGGLVEQQPSVTIVAIVSVRLPTGELRVVPYQTSVATYAYDIPSQ